MTGKEFIRLRNEQLSIIDAANDAINSAQRKVEIPPMSKLRRAEAKDILYGAIIYYRVDQDRPYWQMVAEVRHPDDDFKAYVAEDGCRYGLHEAWVEKD